MIRQTGVKPTPKSESVISWAKYLLFLQRTVHIPLQRKRKRRFLLPRPCRRKSLSFSLLETTRRLTFVVLSLPREGGENIWECVVRFFFFLRPRQRGGRGRGGRGSPKRFSCQRTHEPRMETKQRRRPGVRHWTIFAYKNMKKSHSYGLKIFPINLSLSEGNGEMAKSLANSGFLPPRAASGLSLPPVND